ncbi:hypothetical protein FISHEDRAFT_72654 [Fistulina hepatica ATCC 64428]|nr:hypothetical protein FISHEDRAFT_72654 [Fistulina hepatica ATCC 64428]
MARLDRSALRMCPRPCYLLAIATLAAGHGQPFIATEPLVKVLQDSIDPGAQAPQPTTSDPWWSYSTQTSYPVIDISTDSPQPQSVPASPSGSFPLSSSLSLGTTELYLSVDLPTSIGADDSIPGTASGLSIPTESIVSIPAANSSTPTPLPKKVSEDNGSFNAIYLVPLFGLLGLVLVGGLVWLLYNCLTRHPRERRRRASGELEIGPPYHHSPATSYNDDGGMYYDKSHPPEGKSSLRSLFAWPSKNPDAGPLCEYENPYSEREWAHSRVVSPERTQDLIRKTTPTELSRLAAESSSLLHKHSDTRKQTRRPLLDLGRRRYEPLKSGGQADSDDNGPSAEATKNLATQLFERKRSISRRIGHVRAGSDGHLANAPSDMEDVQLHAPGKAACSRSSLEYDDEAMSRSSSRCTATSFVDMGGNTQWKPGSGFRMVVESPLRMEDTPFAWPTDDKYTIMPSRSQSRRHRSSSPVKTVESLVATANHTKTANMGARPAGPRQERTPREKVAAILPQSPTLLTSPPFESQLCFSPLPELQPFMLHLETPPVIRSKPSTKSRIPRASTTTLSRTSMEFTEQPNSKSSPSRRRLQSPRAPTLPFPTARPGPFPTTRPDKYRGRLVKPTAPAPKSTSNMHSRSDAYGNPVDTRRVALKKVHAILGKGWDARELAERNALDR